jgi:outer membrane receptor protein involved in Fe transport
MSKLTRTLSGSLLATTAMLAAQAAYGQTGAAPQGGPAAPAAGAAAPASEADAADVEEVVVLGRFIPEPLQNTSEVASFLTTEDLARTGDDDAAGALTRVTGLSLVSGRFVYVRGLGERYSSALLNGSPLPSPEPLQRVVPLDLFPSSILAGVTVQKTYSANYPGEFGGGVIDLQTVNVPREPFLSVSVGAGFDTETSTKTGLTYGGGRSDWLGFDDGTRKTPIGLRLFAPNRRLSTATPAQQADIARSFENSNINVLQIEDDVPLDGSFGISAGREFATSYGDVGVVFVGGYESEWQNREGKQQYGRVDAGELTVLTDQDFASTEQDVTWNALLGFGLDTQNHDLRWTNLWIRNTTKEARTREGFTVDLGSNVREDFTEWFERELLLTQLTGKHLFGDLQVDWRASYASTSRDVPYETVTQYGRDAQGRLRHNPSSDLNRTRFSSLEDTAIGAGFDLSYDLDIGFLRDAELRGGYSYTKNDRDSDSRSFRYRSDPAAGNAIQYERIDYIKSDYNISNGLVFLEETTPLDGTAAYKGQLIVNGAYAQIDAEVIPLVRASVGLRYEDGVQRVRTVNSLNELAFRPSSGEIEEQYLLPSATITWNFAEDMQVRFGASKTIARPQFRELSPQQFLDPETDRTNVGNPALTDSELLNLDARFEWFFERGQYFTLSGFYKSLDRPIEAYIFEPSIFTVAQSYINAPKAVLWGAEIEGKKYFDAALGYDWIDRKRWLVQANYTYTTSEVQVESGDVVFLNEFGGAPRPASDYIIDGSKLQGQSEHIANLQFGFEDEDARSQATVLVNYASERITARGNLSAGQPDFVSDPGVTLDFVYRKTFEVMDRELGFSFEARNLTGEDSEEYQEFGGGRVDVNRYDLGRTFSASLTARF